MESQEIWKDIVGWERVYQVSNFGNIKSLDRHVNHPTSSIGTKIIGRKMKVQLLKCGYYYVSLRRSDFSKTYRVHRLVAKAFISNPHEKETVNHKDGNKLNNHVSNLEWLTSIENTHHAINVLGKQARKRGGTNIHIRIPTLKISLDGFVVGVYESRIEAAKENNTTPSNINKCIMGIQSTHAGYIWK